MMLWSSGSLGLTAQLRGDVVPTGAQPPKANYKLEWKGGGCEQWKSFGGLFLGVGHTTHSCFEGCAARQRNGLFYRENDGLCGCVMAGCSKRNDHEGYQYFDYYIRDFDAIDKQGTVQERMGEMKVVKSDTAESTDEFTLEWTGGGCNEWEKLGGRFLGAGHTVKDCFDICSKDTYWNGPQKKSLGKDVFFRGSDGMCGCVPAGCTKRADTPSYDHYVKAVPEPEPSADSAETALQPDGAALAPKASSGSEEAPAGHPWGTAPGGTAPGGTAAGQHHANGGGTNPAGTWAGQHPGSSGGTNPAGTAAGQPPTSTPFSCG